MSRLLQDCKVSWELCRWGALRYVRKHTLTANIVIADYRIVQFVHIISICRILAMKCWNIKFIEIQNLKRQCTPASGLIFSLCVFKVYKLFYSFVFCTNNSTMSGDIVVTTIVLLTCQVRCCQTSCARWKKYTRHLFCTMVASNVVYLLGHKQKVDLNNYEKRWRVYFIYQPNGTTAMAVYQRSRWTFRLFFFSIFQ